MQVGSRCEGVRSGVSRGSWGPGRGRKGVMRKCRRRKMKEKKRAEWKGDEGKEGKIEKGGRREGRLVLDVEEEIDKEQARARRTEQTREKLMSVGEEEGKGDKENRTREK